MPQCQFLFSAVFVFQKSCTLNILGIARDKAPVPYFSVTKPEPEGKQQGASQVARQGPGAARPGPAPGLCLGPPGLRRLRLFAHIFSVSGKPWTPEQKSTKSSDAAVNSNPSSGGFWSSSRHPAGGRNHHRRLLHHHACLRGDAWVVHHGTTGP